MAVLHCPGLALPILCLLLAAPLRAEEGPELTDTSWDLAGRVQVKAGKLGRTDDEGLIEAEFGFTDFEFDEGLGLPLTGFPNVFEAKRGTIPLEFDDFEVGERVGRALGELLDAEIEILDTTIDSDRSKAKVKSKASVLLLSVSAKIEATIESTADGVTRVDEVSLKLKAKGVLEFAFADTCWEGEGRSRFKIAKVGKMTEDDELELQLIDDEDDGVVHELFDAFGELLEGGWSLDEKGRLQLDFDEEVLDEALVSLVEQLGFATFVFLDDAEISDVVTRAKLKTKAGDIIRLTLKIKFVATGTLDGETVSLKGTYASKGTLCLDA